MLKWQRHSLKCRAIDGSAPLYKFLASLFRQFDSLLSLNYRYPANTRHEGTFRTVSVDLLAKGRGKLAARTRDGYYAPRAGASDAVTLRSGIYGRHADPAVEPKPAARRDRCQHDHQHLPRALQSTRQAPK